MLKLRKSEDRGTTGSFWLESQHTFSFGDYYDPAHMGFGALRVINEDWIKASSGFGLHPHRDMEILTYVLSGSLEHKDTIGTSSLILPGDVQCMSAGTGISHSERNSSKNTPLHLLQIWILPETLGLPPSYEQKNFLEKREKGPLTLLASPDGREDSLILHQDVSLYILDLGKNQLFSYALAKGRMAWVQMARGSVALNGQPLTQGDGAALTDEKDLVFQAGEKGAEILIFDLLKSDF
jgi:quercetin 2,3-dioxygenase